MVSETYKMPTKRRPPNVTMLTGQRMAETVQLRSSVLRLKRYLGLQVDATPAASLGSQTDSVTGHITRSQEVKELFKLSVPLCGNCHGRNVECFQSEYMQLMKKGPLFCEHDRAIVHVEALGRDALSDLGPIIIPAQRGIARSPDQAAPRESITSNSSLTLEKLEREKAVVVKAYEQLCAINRDLIIAVVGVEEGELVGYDDVYSVEALETFLDQYTLMFSDACTVADVKLEELRRLEEVRSRNSVFSSPGRTEQREAPRVAPDADTVSRVTDWQRSNVERELSELEELQERRQPPRQSATAQHGSPERLQQQQELLSSLTEVNAPATQSTSTANTSVVAPLVNTLTTPVVRTPATVTTASASAGEHTTTFGPLLGPQNEPPTELPGVPPVSGPLVPRLTTPSVPPAVTSAAPTIVTTAAATPITSSGSGQIDRRAPPGLSSDEQEATLLFQQMRRKYRGLTELIRGVDSSISVLTSSSTMRSVEKLRDRIKEIRSEAQDYEIVGQRFILKVKQEQKLSAMQDLAKHLDYLETGVASLRTHLDAKEDSLEDEPTTRTARDKPVEVSRFRSYLERSKLPVFSGQVEEFPEFRKQFQELVRNEDIPEAVLLSKLKASVPAEGKELLVGVEIMSQAWSNLQKRYGDRKVAILTIQARLSKLVLTGEDYEKIEQLSREVVRAFN